MSTETFTQCYDNEKISILCSAVVAQKRCLDETILIRTYDIIVYVLMSKHSTPLDKLKYPQRNSKEARWPSGRALDSGARGREFDPHSGRRVVSLSKIHLHPKKYW